MNIWFHRISAYKLLFLEPEGLGLYKLLQQEINTAWSCKKMTALYSKWVLLGIWWNTFPTSFHMKALQISMFPNISGFPRSIPISFQLNRVQFRLNVCLKIMMTQFCVWNVVMYFWCVRRPHHFSLLSFRTYSWLMSLHPFLLVYWKVLLNGCQKWWPSHPPPSKTTPNRDKGLASTY